MPAFERPVASLSPTSSTSTNTQQVAINIVFGIFAVAASILTLWKGHRLWRTMRKGAAHDPEGRGPGRGTVVHDRFEGFSLLL